MKLENRKKRMRRPDLMFVLTLFVGAGVLVTAVAQGAERTSADNAMQRVENTSGPALWVRSLWDLGLISKIQNWQPTRINYEDRSEGWNLSRPFGNQGPALKFSTAMPVQLVRILHAGGADTSEVSTRSDMFLFLEKRW